VRGMLAEMTAHDLAEWEAFFSLEPWGAEADEHRAGVISATIANVNRRKGAAPFRPSDFFPSRIRALAQASMSVVDRVKAIFGGRK
jgi:hypothetical protein